MKVWPPSPCICKFRQLLANMFVNSFRSSHRPSERVLLARHPKHLRRTPSGRAHTKPRAAGWCLVVALQAPAPMRKPKHVETSAPFPKHALGQQRNEFSSIRGRVQTPADLASLRPSSQASPTALSFRNVCQVPSGSCFRKCKQSVRRGVLATL